jgi:general stress protein 26
VPTLKERILDVVKGPCLAGLATTTKDGKPWVRYVTTQASDDLTFRFSSFSNARKIAQIESHPEVHLTCGITDPTNMTLPYLQIQGHAKFTTDREARHAFWNDRMRLLFKGPDDPNYCVVIVHAYRIEFCRVGMEPEVWERHRHE